LGLFVKAHITIHIDIPPSVSPYEKIHPVTQFYSKQRCVGLMLYITKSYTDVSR